MQIQKKDLVHRSRYSVPKKVIKKSNFVFLLSCRPANGGEDCEGDSRSSFRVCRTSVRMRIFCLAFLTIILHLKSFNQFLKFSEITVSFMCMILMISTLLYLFAWFFCLHSPVQLTPFITAQNNARHLVIGLPRFTTGEEMVIMCHSKNMLFSSLLINIVMVKVTTSEILVF